MMDETAAPSVRVLLPTASGRQTAGALWALLRPKRWFGAVTAVVLVARAVVGLLGPAVLGRIVDLVVDGAPASAITTPVLILVAVAIGEGVLLAGGGAMVARLGEAMLAELRERVVRRALTIPLEQVERAGTGDLLARVGGDVSVVSRIVREALPQLATVALTIGLTVVGLAVLDWRLALAGLCAAPIQAHTLRWYLPRAIPLYAAQRVVEGERAQQLFHSMDGAATIRAFRLASTHTAMVVERSLAVVDMARKAIRLATRFFSRLNLAEVVGLGTVLVVGFFLVRNGTVTVGTATAAALYFQRLFDPFNILLATIDDILSAGASLARLVGVADLPEPLEPAEVVTPRDASITVVGVHHAYEPGHDVLHGVDFSLAPGERVALVGPSGAGKTTLAKLVAGIHRPTAGRVLIGGVDLVELSPTAIRQAVTLITQEVHTFAGTLSDDLRLAQPDAGPDELVAALERVGALGWAQALPDGLDTVVGEGGHRLTATQAQQLALARLVLADAPVAVLDEASAEAGSAGARILEAAAAAAIQGRTALVVAHRLTQAAAADRVIVLDAGRVVEVGTHDELVAAGGPYATLWTAWSDSRPSVAGAT